MHAQRVHARAHLPWSGEETKKVEATPGESPVGMVFTLASLSFSQVWMLSSLRLPLRLAKSSLNGLLSLKRIIFSKCLSCNQGWFCGQLAGHQAQRALHFVPCAAAAILKFLKLFEREAWNFHLHEALQMVCSVQPQPSLGHVCLW